MIMSPRRWIPIALAFTLSVTLIFMGMGFLSPVASAHPSTHALLQTTGDVTNEVPTYVTLGDPYVRVTNGVATIDPTISMHLDAAVVSQVQQAVQQYNSLPLADRLSEST